MDKNKRPNVEELRQSLGATAEMALIFLRAALGAGANMEEATRLTQAYIAALLFGRMSQPKPPEDE